jgi:hypothetical protein
MVEASSAFFPQEDLPVTRRTALPFLLALLCVLALPRPASAQIGFTSLLVPSPSDVVKAIDALTRKDSDTTIDVKFGKTTAHGKLLVASSRVKVALERSSRNWRGRVTVVMTVPSDVTYSVDLTKIKPEHVRPDAANGRLVVIMPTPQVEAVTPLLHEVEVDNSYRKARFKLLDRDTSRELQNVMLREDYQGKARSKAEAHLPQAREEGKAALRSFLQRLLGPSFPGLKVVVE